MPGHLRVGQAGITQPNLTSGWSATPETRARERDMTVTTAVVVLPRRVAVWANRRAMARNSLTGIELACALCAAVWFSAGTPLTALAGGAALGGGWRGGGARVPWRVAPRRAPRAVARVSPLLSIWYQSHAVGFFSIEEFIS